MPIAALLAVLVTAAPPTGSLERALGLLDALDARTITVRYENDDLEDVLEDLDERLPLSIRGDWDVLDRLAVGRYEEIDLAFDAAPASTVLAAIAAQLGDELERPVIEAHAGQIVLTTVIGSASMRVTDVYDVRDLLADDDAVAGLRATRPLPVAPAPGAAPGPRSPDADDPPSPSSAGDDEPSESRSLSVPSGDAASAIDDFPPPAPLTPGAELMLLVAEHVDPEAWMEFGGARARIDERDGVVLVTAPPSVHRMFRDALRRLRRTNPTELAIECALLDLPRATYDRLGRRHDPTSAGLGRALLLAPEATVHWSATNAVAIGESITVDATRAEVHVRLELATRFERGRGLLALDVAFETEAPDDHRSVRTVLAVPTRRGGGVVELPGAVNGDRVRVLVLVPQRR